MNPDADFVPNLLHEVTRPLSLKDDVLDALEILLALIEREPTLFEPTYWIALRDRVATSTKPLELEEAFPDRPPRAVDLPPPFSAPVWVAKLESVRAWAEGIGKEESTKPPELLAAERYVAEELLRRLNEPPATST